MGTTHPFTLAYGNGSGFESLAAHHHHPSSGPHVGGPSSVVPSRGPRWAATRPPPAQPLPRRPGRWGWKHRGPLPVLLVGVGRDTGWAARWSWRRRAWLWGGPRVVGGATFGGGACGLAW